MQKIKSILRTHYLFLLFVIFYLLFTVFTYKLFPITADEKFRYQRGQELLYNFINSKQFQTDIYPIKQPDSYYFYGTLLTILNPKFYYEWYHLQNMLVALIAFISLYLIVFEYTKNAKFSILGPIFLFFTPSFSGHIAAAPIDMPFATFYLLNLYLIYKYRNEGFSFRKVLTLGFSFWPVLGIRPLGFEFFLIYFFINFLLTDKDINKTFVLDNLKSLFLIFIISNFLLVITWPYLGLNYFKNLNNIFHVNASYDKWDNKILFNGELISKEDRPQSYLFTYLLYTTPFYILILGILSLVKFSKEQKLKVLIIFSMFLNFILYLILKPVIYNGIRHFIFLIPHLVLLAVFGLWDLQINTFKDKFKNLVIIVTSVSVLWTGWQFIKLFPIHYSYFNELSGGTVNNLTRYETDYWGASYKEAALYIKDTYKDKLKVYSCNIGFGVDYYLDKKHEVLIDSEESNFIICDIVMDKQRGYKGRIIKEIDLDGKPFVLIRENKPITSPF